MVDTIYAEDEIRGTKKAQEIISKFRHAKVISIERFGEVFNPSNQLIYEPTFELDVDPNDLPELEEITEILGQLEVRECKSNYATSKSVEAFASGEMALYNLTDKDFDVKVVTNLYPSITESGRLRADISAEIAWEMFSDLFLTLSSTTQYDSGKPDDNITRNEKLDYNIVMGVSWRP